MRHAIHSFFILFLFALLFGCQANTQTSYAEVDNEIAGLTSNEQKKNYLEKIMEDDQAVRGDQKSEIILKYGHNSPEHIAYAYKMISQDSLDLVKIERYLKQYGYPNKSELGKSAALAPWLVIHHSQTYTERERNFKYIYGAYLNGDIDDTAFSMYLNRMYEFKNNNRFQIESPFTSEDEIEQLISALDLTEQKEMVIKSRE